MDKNKVSTIQEQVNQLTSMLWVLSEALGNGGQLPGEFYESTAIALANMSADISAALDKLGEDA